MKVYLAGPCDSENRTLMVSIAKQLRDMSYEVYCPFELKIENAWDMSQEKWAQKVFDADITAINNCDAMIMISRGRMSSAGTNFENGYMFALNKPIYVIQITDSPTSLMTFCGCSYFLNSNLNDLNNNIKWILNRIYNNDIINYKKECKTILT